MRVLFCLSFMTALLAGCAHMRPETSQVPEATPALPATQLRVMSYNIHHGIGMDRRVDLSRTIETIRAAKPDLVALQELDRKTNRANQVDQLQALAEGTGMQ